MKNIRFFYLKFFIFLVMKFSIYLNRRVFVAPQYTFVCGEISFDTVQLTHALTEHIHRSYLRY